MFDPIKKKVITDKDGKFETTVTINGGPGISSVNVSVSAAGIAAAASAIATPSTNGSSPGTPTTTPSPGTPTTTPSPGTPTTTPTPTTTFAPSTCSRPRFTITLPGGSGDSYHMNFQFISSDYQLLGSETTSKNAGPNDFTVGTSCAPRVRFFIYESEMGTNSPPPDAQMEGYTRTSGPYSSGGTWLWNFTLDT